MVFVCKVSNFQEWITIDADLDTVIISTGIKVKWKELTGLGVKELVSILFYDFRESYKQPESPFSLL